MACRCYSICPRALGRALTKPLSQHLVDHRSCAMCISGTSNCIALPLYSTGTKYHLQLPVVLMSGVYITSKQIKNIENSINRKIQSIELGASVPRIPSDFGVLAYPVHQTDNYIPVPVPVVYTPLVYITGPFLFSGYANTL